ncbi:MAG: carbohydrate ABC transporter permease, partial [Acidimicrobiales bacterium]
VPAPAKECSQVATTPEGEKPGGEASPSPAMVTVAGAGRVAEPKAEPQPARRGRRQKTTGTLRKGENLFGWIFVSPSVAILLLFLLAPIVLALYISFTNWSGLTNPLSSSVKWTGLANYKTLLTQPGLYQQDFGTSIRNNLYFVAFTVPLQTALALALAVVVNNKLLRAKGLFRTIAYFPSVTSSIAITVIFIFLFQGSGVINTILGFFGIQGPNWLYDTRGVFTLVYNAFGVNNPPALVNHQFLGLPIWGWVAGPSLGMCVVIIMLVWTTSGTFMLFFLAALQQISEDLDEASEIDGATPWQHFRRVTLPLLRPSLVLVLLLGFISTWQIFDQIFLIGPLNPATVTPAYFSYEISFRDSDFGAGAAVAFLLFCLIVFLTLIQRKFIKEDLTK